jgi:hypothetical protein
MNLGAAFVGIDGGVGRLSGGGGGEADTGNTANERAK